MLLDWLAPLQLGPEGWGDELLVGAILTLEISACSYALGLLLGLIGAGAKLSKSRPARLAAASYTTIVRAVPELLLILLIYYTSTSAIQRLVIALGGSTAFQVNGFLAACLALGIVQGAYATEVFRGAIMAIERGQFEAARALGLRGIHIFRFIVAPEMIRLALPALGNLWLVVLKESSLISVVGFSELLFSAKIAAGSTRMYLYFFTTVAVCYLVLSLASGALFNRLEKRFGLERRGEA
jgi:polar amino acid transport system permease protein